MFNLQIDNNSQVTGDYDQYSPFPNGVYQVSIDNADMEAKIGSPTSKHPGKNMTMVALEMTVYGAAKDGGNRKHWENIIVEHEASQTSDSMAGFVQINQAKLTDLVMQYLAATCGGDVNQSPFVNGVDASTIGHLAGQCIYSIEFKINKKANENEVKNFFPTDEHGNVKQPTQQQQQSSQQQTHQQPQNQQMQQAQQSQSMGQQQQQSQSPQQGQGGGFNPNGMGGNPNSNLPPFHQQQQQN